LKIRPMMGEEFVDDFAECCASVMKRCSFHIKKIV
jgi:hypothetical protein